MSYIKKSVSEKTSQKSLDAFEGLAENYNKIRPNYPEAMFHAILSFLYEKRKNANNSLTIADVGCGTGISTRALLSCLHQACYLIGVEPGKDMLITAKKSSPKEIVYVEGAAESLPLNDQSLDLVTVAQAIQWFDRTAFYKEAERVLKTDGVIAIYENNRDWEHSEFLHKHEAFLERYSIDKIPSKKYSRYYRNFPYADELLSIFKDITVKNFRWVRKMEPEEFLRMAKTSTQVKRAEKYIGEKRSNALILENASSYVEDDGKIEVKYVTKLYLGRKRPVFPEVIGLG